MNPNSPKKILVIEDETSIARLCRRVFEMESHEVDVAPDGEQGQEKIGTNSYDLILMDIRLPKINGLQIYEWVLSHHRELADTIAFMTGSVMGEKLLLQLNETGRPYLLKPFSIAELKHFVTGLLSEV